MSASDITRSANGTRQSGAIEELRPREEPGGRLFVVRQGADVEPVTVEGKGVDRLACGQESFDKVRKVERARRDVLQGFAAVGVDPHARLVLEARFLDIAAHQAI